MGSLWVETAMSLDLIARLDEIVPDPGCIYAALEPILTTCEAPENVGDRTQLAVRLALCEFAAAGIDHPPACDGSELITCTRALAANSTWWTTFSGQYRHISLVCREHQPQHAAHQVVGVFRDAHGAFTAYKAGMDSELAALQRATTAATDELALVTTQLATGLEQLDARLGCIQVRAGEAGNDAAVLSQAVSSLTAAAYDQQALVAGLTSGIEARVNGLHTQLAGFGSTMDAVRHQHEATALHLEEAANHTVNVLGRADTVLTSVLVIFKLMYAALKLAAVLSGPAAAAVLILVLMYRRRPEVIFF